MKAKRAEYLISAAKPEGFPDQDLPELAFAGRSNVGKSSLMNKLVGVNGLARTSSTPGRTRLLNWFEVLPPVGEDVYFVDLPGYGYAKVPKFMRASWQPLVESYLGNREVLRAVVVLVDARRLAQNEEIGLMEWLKDAGIPTIVVLTKADKLPKSKRKLAAHKCKKEMGLSTLVLIASALEKPIPFFFPAELTGMDNE